jgi:hypothetical protein
MSADQSSKKLGERKSINNELLIQVKIFTNPVSIFPLGINSYLWDHRLKRKDPQECRGLKNLQLKKSCL